MRFIVLSEADTSVLAASNLQFVTAAQTGLQAMSNKLKAKANYSLGFLSFGLYL